MSKKPPTTAFQFYSSEVVERLSQLHSSFSEKMSLIEKKLEKHRRKFDSKFLTLSKETIKSYENFEKLTSSASVQKELERWREPIDRYKAAHDNPTTTKSKLWLMLGDELPGDLADVIGELPDPRAKPGRPTGRGHFSSDASLMPEMEKLVGDGMQPKTAARKAVIARGYETGINDKAGYVAKLFKAHQSRGKK